MADATRMLKSLYGRRRIALDQLKKLDAKPKAEGGKPYYVPASTGRPSKSKGTR